MNHLARVHVVGAAGKRTLRLPTLLALVLFATLSAVAWAGLGRALAEQASLTVVSHEQRPASVTYREPLANGALISLEIAQQSARSFLGQSDLTMIGGLERGAVGTSSYAVYYFESAAGAEELTLKIDGRTAEVLEMTWLASLTRATASSPLDPLLAEARAEEFAASRFLGFKTLTLVDRGTAPGAGGNTLHTFKWALVAAESGAELPTSVAVTVSQASGDIVWYLAQRESTTVDARPMVEREEAVAVAAALVAKAGRWDVSTPLSVRLRVAYDHDNRQRLVWAITFASKDDEYAQDRPNLRVQIDARTGDPIPTAL